MSLLSSISLLLAIVLVGAKANFAIAQTDASNKEQYIAASWASLIYKSTNGRAGPSKDFQIKWKYHHKYLPIKILRKTSQWSQIEDMSGDVVWMHNSVFSERRTAIIISPNPAFLYAKNEANAKVIARIAPNVIVRIDLCHQSRCKVRVKDYKGWVDSHALWGAIDY